MAMAQYAANALVGAALALVGGMNAITHAPEVDHVRANTWPGEVRFRDLPESGVDLTVRTASDGPTRVTVVDETRGLDPVPGFTPRPPDVVAGTREDGDVVAVARTYEF